MNKFLTACLIACALCGAASATTILSEGFETFLLSGWINTSVDQYASYSHTGSYSARFNAVDDSLVTPPLTNAQTLTFWTYTTSDSPTFNVETSASASGPWTTATGSPFSNTSGLWTERSINLASSGTLYIRFSKSGSGYVYIDDVLVEDGGTPANSAPVLAAIGNQSIPVGNALNFTVSAADTDNDDIILSVSNLPPGAVFNTVTNAGTVSNTFSWASASPIGVYTSTFYAADNNTNDSETITITVTNLPSSPPLTSTPWNVFYNLPYQSNSGSDYPGQFVIRDVLTDRIDALQNGDSAILSTFTFSAEYGAGTIMNAMSDALDRGALISFVADGDISLGTVYGGTNSLLDLSTRTVNPLMLSVDGSTSGIMHDKLGLFDYGGSNQWVFIASWNFTLAASADQWNIALEARSPSLYSIYISEAAELLAGRFHDDPAKSHAHDGSTFSLDGSWGTNFVRFAPYPDDTPGGNNAETDIINLIDQAQSNIVFALNKFNRPLIRDALISAANRGADIKGVMPRSDTDPGGVSDDVYNALTNYVEFLPAYAEADYSVLDGGESDLIHAKYMVIDPQSTNAVVIHGSANWTAEALVNDNDNDENTVILRHNGIAEAFYDHFQRITGTGAYSEGNSTIVSWDFADGDQIADGGIAANAAQTVIRVPAPSSYTYTADALSCNGWSSGSGTTYWETSFNTTNHIDIKVSSRQLASSTGPADFKLQYKIGADGTYADVPYSDVHVPDGGNGLLTRVLLPEGCENQPAVFLHWIMTSDIAANGGSIGSSGAGRIDDIIITGTAYNQPPALDPIGNRTVFVGEALQFTVTAADPVDGDLFILSATNLPTGAVFTNDTFTWDIAAPIGVYDVTFTATDTNGSDSATIAITVLQKPRLLISEIADPSESADFRFVELYNAGTNTVDLADGNWYLSRQNNGGESWYEVALTGIVAAAETYVIAKGQDEFLAAYGFAPQQEGSAADGNGNDAVYIFYGGNHTNGILIDIYGEPDTDGIDTAWDYEDSRAVRNNNIQQPNTTWTASEWAITTGATTNDMSPGVHGPTPEFQGLENQFVFLGDNLSLIVTAVNTVRTDVITLSATALPAGATFPPATGTNTASSTLNWAIPAAGVYTATFAAEGEVDATVESITITVSSTAEIDGKFYGWKSGTIVKLDNGQFWRNTGGASSIIDPPLRNPQVTVTNVLTTRRMFVENVASYTTVERIAVTESFVTNAFSGLHNGNIYELGDGTVWEQTTFENISSSADSVTTWRWTENSKTYMRFLDRDDVVIGTCQVVASELPDSGAVISEIDGYFRGWKNDRVFALANGEFWQQTVSDSSSDTLYRPEVTLTNYLETGTWRMYVDRASAPGYVEVQQLTNVTRTKIDGTFYGFGIREFFHLQNGEWWRQTSFETSASTRSSPEVLIWEESGNFQFEMPDEGRTVTAQKLTVTAESSVTNTFNGLHYGNTYQLANGEDWLQVSFENISSNAVNPDAMLWVDGNDTNLLLRGSGDQEIGNCTVADPTADGDGDRIANAAEIIAGTDLADRDSFFQITEAVIDGSRHCVLSWDAVEGRRYTILWAASLDQAFHPQATVDAPTNSWTDTEHTTDTEGFYEIEVSLIP
ncbi:MAG: lamin tail domain-containing protein [Kiritimatiellales bacterium]|nr:lamin tail domain-containing protein [Kiritimatiellota bacterium]MBL7011391.1 lamin tail domain-containing protein [Kiritimatiellales bacterium]